VTMHFMAAAPDGQPSLGQELAVSASPAQFVGHPDTETDIAMIGIGGAIETLANGGTPAFFRSIDTSLCATSEVLKDFEPIEPVTFIGYPNGLFDSVSATDRPAGPRGHCPRC
jgi:hypothetical protein